MYFSWAATWQHKQNGCAPSEDSDQPGHPPSLIRVFAVRMKIVWVLSYPFSAQRRRWSDWANAQADLSLRWKHGHFVGFVMSRHNSCFIMQIVNLINYIKFSRVDDFGYLKNWGKRCQPNENTKPFVIASVSPTTTAEWSKIGRIYFVVCKVKSGF